MDAERVTLRLNVHYSMSISLVMQTIRDKSIPYIS